MPRAYRTYGASVAIVALTRPAPEAILALALGLSRVQGALVWGVLISMGLLATHLESTIDAARFPADRPQTLDRGRPLWVRYDLEAVGRRLTKMGLSSRPTDMWRYRELLPLGETTPLVTLGETMTPLVRCLRLGAQYGLAHLWIKDEARLPTGSFKSRGLAVAMTKARELGIRRVAIATAGNAGGAAAAYAARAGLELYVFMPADTPPVNQFECRLAGARAFLVEGSIRDCASVVSQGSDALGWFDLSTLKEPYRLEGKKTMGFELAEQLAWQLPDVILYPTGGGTGLIGMWKAFAEMVELGWVAGESLPRMVAVQSSGCAPIVRAFAAGARHAEPFEGAATIASGIRVPSAIGDFLILDAIRQSNGKAVEVDEAQIGRWMRLAAQTEGLALCPEAATCVGALESLTADGWLGLDERVVIFNTAAAQKYAHAFESRLPTIDPDNRIDWDRVASGDGS